MTLRTKRLLILAAILVVGSMIFNAAQEARKTPQQREAEHAAHQADANTRVAQERPAVEAKHASVTAAAPFLTVTIESAEYDRGYGGVDGYFKIRGRAENTGSSPAFSPTIKAQITDHSGKTILAETSAWPAGQYLKAMTPGTAAAFQLSSGVPGGPERVRWRVWVDAYEHKVIAPK